jgi:chromosome segregation ATPase
MTIVWYCCNRLLDADGFELLRVCREARAQDEDLKSKRDLQAKTLTTLDGQRRNHCTQVDKLEEQYENLQEELKSLSKRAQDRERQIEVEPHTTLHCRITRMCCIDHGGVWNIALQR